MRASAGKEWPAVGVVFYLISAVAVGGALAAVLLKNLVHCALALTLAFLGLTYLVIPSIFMGLHVFVAFLQAYIFVLLTMIYVGGAVAEEH